MKNLLLIIVLYFLLISCVSKNNYVLNSQNKPRPTATFKFHLDKKSFVLSPNLIIDTNSIYIATSYKRKMDEIKCIFYRFYPNGIVYEFVLKGEPIELAIADTAMANYGKYRIMGPNKIRMEFMFKFDEKASNKIMVIRNFYDAKVVGVNLEFNPILYSKEKGFYSEVWDGMSFAYGPGVVLIPFLLGTIYLVDAAIPDKKAIFYKVDIKNIGNY
ncbi:MAG TPA: hypothetical protein VIV55_01350 [Flavobacterium sp.]